MDTQNVAERKELHRSIWNIANDLRDAVDGWDFKSYVLSIMFYRYISENLTAYVNKGEIESGNKKFIEDSFKNGTVKTTGTDIKKILPPTSRFDGGNRDQKKQGNISKILAFFERFFGLGA